MNLEYHECSQSKPSSAPGPYCRRRPTPLPCARPRPLRDVRSLCKITMPPGRKSSGPQNRIEDMTDIERVRAQTIMRNNQVLRSLGITTLASLVNSSTTKRKGMVREESDPLYEPEDMEETGDVVLDEVANVANTKNPTISRNNSVRGTKASKRVVAPQEQDVPTRVTRQKTRDLALASSPDSLPNATPTHDVLVSSSDPS